MMTWIENYLAPLGPCRTGVRQAENYAGPQEAWDAWGHGPDLLWVLVKAGVRTPKLRECIRDIVRTLGEAYCDLAVYDWRSVLKLLSPPVAPIRERVCAANHTLDFRCRNPDLSRPALSVVILCSDLLRLSIVLTPRERSHYYGSIVSDFYNLDDSAFDKVMSDRIREYFPSVKPLIERLKERQCR